MTTRQELVEQVSVPEALEMLGLELPERVPGHVFCFLHGEDTPSLMIYEDHWYAYCCGTGGDVVNLVMKAAGLNYHQAVAFLDGAVDQFATSPRVQRTEREVIDLTERWALEPHGTTTAMIEAERLIAEKWPSLTLDDILRFGVKLTQHALWIPHWDLESRRIVGIKTRSLYTGNKNAVKGSTFTESLYVPAGQAWNKDVAILVEGESDAWAMTKAVSGRALVYGLPSGANAWRPWFEKQLNHRNVLVFLDNDDTGRSAKAKILKRLSLFPSVGVVEGVIPAEFNDVAEALAGGWTPDLVLKAVAA